ncbi:MAG TPA: protein phosphatase 2C domain-containing protein [Rhodothermales bacterium]|nr:protein phosphatase 2C domain-containing protein [Rhodothermales bacterium]
MPKSPRHRSAAQSDVGRQREANEDTYVHRPADGLFAVIDGMGGYAGGAVAAEEARQALIRRVRHRTGAPEIRLREAVALANNQIFRRAGHEPDLAHMACVLTVALVEGSRVYVAHVGDTRLYKIKAEGIEKLTHDHSVVGVREDAGELSEAEAMAHPRRNEVLRDVGSEEHGAHDANFIEYLEADFEPDAAFLLCSDGLTDLIPEAEIQTLVRQQAGRPEQSVQHLIDRANEAGGTDNITVVLVEGEAFGASAVEQETAPVADAASPTSPWAYFAGGLGVMLILFLIGAALWTSRDAEPTRTEAPPDSTLSFTESFMRWKAEALPGDGWTERTPLASRLVLRSLPDGAMQLVPPPGLSPDSVASAAGPWARGFWLSLPDSSAVIGILIEGAADSTDFNVLLARSDSTAMEP